VRIRAYRAPHRRAYHNGLLAAILCLACSDDTGTRSGPGSAPTGPLFRDVTADSGIDFVHDAGKTAQKHLPETMGAGAAVCDVNGDGNLDLYFIQGGRLPGAGGRSKGVARIVVNRLFVGDGRGGFRDATDESGAAAHSGYGMGVAAGDANGDGHVDFYVTNFGPDVLLLGDGTGGFRDGTAEAGIYDGRWTTAALFFDPDGDGDLDLYVCGYVEVDVAHPPWCGDRRPGWRSTCHPDFFDGIPDRFWRNDGAGHFTDATVAAGLADSAGKGLGAAAFDFDDDGKLDLYVANDSVENRLWRGNGDGTFTDATLLSATGVNGSGATEAGMGIATGDVNEDGRIDLFITNFDDESNTLYRNDGDGFFSDVTAIAGLDAPSRLPVGFGAVLFDADLDGDLDLAVANGHILDNIRLYHDGKTHAQEPLFFTGDGAGRFELDREGAGDFVSEALVGRGLYTGDFDRDGRIDLVLTQNDGPARVYRNVGPERAYLALAGLPPGTRVTIELTDGTTRVREAGGQPSYLGVCEASVHVGLGTADVAGIRIRPPGKSEVELVLNARRPRGRFEVRRANGGFELFER